MANDSYNIEDILSEVKKRREENAKEIIEKDKTRVANDSFDKPISDEMYTMPKETEPPLAEEKPADEENLKPFDEPISDDKYTMPKETDSADMEDADDDDEKMVVTHLFGEKNIEDNEQVEQDADDDEGMVNIFDIQDDVIEEPVQEEQVIDQKPKKKGKGKKIIAIILAIVLIICACAGGYVYYALNKITPHEPVKQAQKQEAEWDGMDELIEVFNPIEETDASQLASLQDMIKTWYYNGEPSSSTHVLNILLVGEDTRGSDILDSGTRADSAMICSINIDKKTIQLTSILRDAYAYWENEPGNADSGTWNKINAAMSLGDISVYKNAVERLYKVQIDNYVIVNFDSFEAIIDAMGGVTLELTSAEINEINNHPKRYNKVYIDKTFDGDKGEVKLTGKQALAYCRIRKLDSDNMRANRQKICISQVAKQAKDVSATTLIKMVNKLLPYVKTDMTKSNILKVAKYALKQGWLNYDMVTINLPDYRLNERGAGGSFNFAGGWIWKADYPHDAYMLQSMIYDKSPITLARTRVDYINCAETGYYSEGAPATWSTIPNENYGEVTTFTTTTKESTEE